MVKVRRRRRLVQPDYNDVDERRCEVQGLDSNMSSHLLEIGGGDFRDASSNSDESEEGEETQETEYDDDDEVEEVKDEETEGETEQSTSAELLAPVRLTEKQQWEVARSKIIGEMKSPTSHVNVAILSVRSTNKEKCTRIWKKYAPEFEEKKVVASVARLLTLLAKKEGHFSESSDEKSSKKSELIWKTNSVESEGYGLLYKLRLHSEEGTGIKDMTAEDIYKHHKVFHQYDVKDFQKWDKNMIKLTDKHRMIIEDDVATFELHHKNIKRKP